MAETTLQRNDIAKLSSLHDAVKGMPEPNVSKPYFDVQARVATQLWEKIDRTHTELFRDTNPSGRVGVDYFANDEHGSAFEKYVKTLTVIESRSSKIDKKAPNPIQPVIQLPENINLNANQNRSNVKLKPIDITTFSGNYGKWISFINMFDSLIHNDVGINKLQKMHYLKSCLSDEAERIISQYSLTEGNYDLVYNALRDRYHNEVILVDTHIIAIISQPDLQVESSESIKELLDVTNENIHALKSLNIETDSWGPILLLLLTKKLDQATKRLWELTLKPKVRPTMKQFLDFLAERFNALGCQQNFKFSITMDGEKRKPDTASNLNHSYRRYNNFRSNQQSFPQKVHQNFHNSTATHTVNKNCPICRGANHNIFQCDRFREASPSGRISLVTSGRLCKNCLWEHQGSCAQGPACRKCGKYHHTFLHVEPMHPSNRNSLATSCNNASSVNATIQGSSSTITPNPFRTPFDQSTSSQTVVRTSHHAQVEQVEKKEAVGKDVIAWDESVLLATAIVLIKSARDNNFYPYRCLLDQASETNYVSEEVVQFLGLRKTSILAAMTGLGGVVTGTSRNVVDFEVSSKRNQSFVMKVQAPVVSKVSNLLPSSYVKKGDWKHLEGLQLADPYFDKPGKIDILLGGSVYGYLLLPGLVKASSGEPVAQETEFGWILSGPTRAPVSKNISVFHLRTSIDDQLKKFFEQEELSQERVLTQEEKDCEKFFNETVKRDNEGRVIVALPFKHDPSLLGSSKGQAITRLMKLESTLTRNQVLKQEYSSILEDYENLNHTTYQGSLMDVEKSGSFRYYLPHHPVFKPESSTTKTRIVFDASARTTTSVSLNDMLMVGPTIQQDLVSILMRWRSHKFVFAADIAKMYRQVVVRKEDRKYQSFLGRKDVDQPIRVYEHNRVTFGVASATYLAVASLQYIAKEEEKRYPEASEVAIRDFYMDDVMSGGDTEEETIKLCSDLKNLLALGKFELRKFISNSAKVLESVPESDRELTLPLEIDIDEIIKTLGVRYQPSRDAFQFKINLQSTTQHPTKRSLLSDTSKLFDPLGWMAPVIIRAKIFFQELWQEGLTWDQKLSHDLT